MLQTDVCKGGQNGRGWSAAGQAGIQQGQGVPGLMIWCWLDFRSANGRIDYKTRTDLALFAT